jgi:hypothetical protein
MTITVFTVILADRLECIETNIKAKSTIFFFACSFSCPVGDALIIIIIIIIIRKRKRRRKRRKITSCSGHYRLSSTSP